MKRIISLSACTLIGFGIGWYFGYMRPAARNQRELLAQYQEAKDSFQMTDQEMAAAAKKIPQYFENVKRQDEMAALVALGVFKELAHGNVDRAKERLAWRVGSYYRLYHGKGGDTNTLAKIEAATREYPAIAAEISKKIENEK